MRVDDWNEEEDIPRPAPAEVAPQPESAEQVAPAVAEAAEEEEEQKLSLRQAVGMAPPWLWLLALFTLGPICLMVMTVLLIIALK